MRVCQFPCTFLTRLAGSLRPPCLLPLPALAQGQRASITLKALAEAFPNRPPAMTRSYLKDACDLAVRVSGAVVVVQE